MPPTKAVDKPTARSGKRNAPADAPLRATPQTGRAGGPTANANENGTSSSEHARTATLQASVAELCVVPKSVHD